MEQGNPRSLNAKWNPDKLPAKGIELNYFPINLIFISA
jgi:hypothetical protein